MFREEGGERTTGWWYKTGGPERSRGENKDDEERVSMPSCQMTSVRVGTKEERGEDEGRMRKEKRRQGEGREEERGREGCVGRWD